MKKLRGAVVGFGKVAAEAHVPGFARSPGFEIVAVVDASAEQRDVAHAQLPEARLYENLEQLAAGEPKLEFVDIATPPRFHAGLAIEALERGYHVLCEKPLAVTISEMGDLRRVARRIHRTLFTVHNWKYAPLFRRLRGLIVAGTVGEPTEIEWSILRPNPPAGATPNGESWRLDPDVAGGGILMDHGWHALYLMLYLIADTPRFVQATVRHERGLAVEDNAECTITFGRCTSRLHLSWTADQRKSSGTVRGPVGTIEIDDESLTVCVEGRSPEVTRFRPAISASSYHPEWFPPLLEDFRTEILHPDQRGRNLAEAVCCGEILAAAYASKGEKVELYTSTEVE